MRSLTRSVIAGSAVAAALSLGLTAADAAGPTTTSHDTTLVLRSVITEQALVDAPPAGPSLGDEQIASGKLRSGGRTVGSFAFTCLTVQTAPDSIGEQCTGWGLLSDGQLEVAGMSRNTDGVHTWAVTGGTGAYVGAQGTLTAQDLSDTVDVLTIELLGG